MNDIERAAESITLLWSATDKHLRCAQAEGNDINIMHYGGQLAGLDLALLVLSWEAEHTTQEVTK